MKHDPFPVFDYLMISQLASLFDMTPVVCGRALKKLGLRERDGEPTAKAFDMVLVKQLAQGEGVRPLWGWKKEDTIRLLEQAGFKRVTPAEADKPTPEPTQSHSPDATTVRLTGPFEARRSDAEGDGFEIADSNGVVAI